MTHVSEAKVSESILYARTRLPILSKLYYLLIIQAIYCLVVTSIILQNAIYSINYLEQQVQPSSPSTTQYLFRKICFDYWCNIGNRLCNCGTFCQSGCKICDHNWKIAYERGTCKG